MSWGRERGNLRHGTGGMVRGTRQGCGRHMHPRPDRYTPWSQLLPALPETPAQNTCPKHLPGALPYTFVVPQHRARTHLQVNTLELTPEGYIDYQRKVNLFLNK